MRSYRVLILVPFFLIASFYLPAQSGGSYRFQHIDQSDGLLHNKILSIVQDERGYVWILTPNGLQRYDGARFVNYPYDPRNPAGITYTSDCRLFADKEHSQLWIVHEGIAKLDLQKNSFSYYSTEQLQKDPSFGFETYKDSVDNPWLAGKFGVLHFDHT